MKLGMARWQAMLKVVHHAEGLHGQQQEQQQKAIYGKQIGTMRMLGMISCSSCSSS